MGNKFVNRNGIKWESKFVVTDEFSFTKSVPEWNFAELRIYGDLEKSPLYRREVFAIVSFSDNYRSSGIWQHGLSRNSCEGYLRHWTIFSTACTFWDVMTTGFIPHFHLNHRQCCLCVQFFLTNKSLLDLL